MLAGDVGVIREGHAPLVKLILGPLVRLAEADSRFSRCRDSLCAVMLPQKPRPAAELTRTFNSPRATTIATDLDRGRCDPFPYGKGSARPNSNLMSPESVAGYKQWSKFSSVKTP